VAVLTLVQTKQIRIDQTSKDKKQIRMSKTNKNKQKEIRLNETNNNNCISDGRFGSYAV
jgi:hypothetical protein